MIKRAIALVIAKEASGIPARWLVVERPPDDEDLPGVWGLPAGSFGEDETVDQLIGRIGRDKLGVELEAGARLNEGVAERPWGRLEMTLWSARIRSGTPEVPQPVDDITQYVDTRWAYPIDLVPGAREGSLCCRLAVRWAARSN